MKLADVASEMQSLLDAPSPAVLTLYRADGEALPLAQDGYGLIPAVTISRSEAEKGARR